MYAHRLLAAVAALLVAAACASDDDDAAAPPDEPVIILDLTEFAEIDPGDVISLRNDGAGGVEWIERRSGRIVTLPDIARFLDDAATAGDVEELATIGVIDTDGAVPDGQRGLVGQTVLDGVRYVAWTDPDTNELLVGALDATDDTPRIVWAGGGTDDGAVGGQLDVFPDGDGERLLLGIGQLTDWARDNGSGAMITLDPVGPPEQEPAVVSSGYINPFAFDVVGTTTDAQLWVADNAVGDDVERIGRADLADRDDHRPSNVDDRAPAAMLALDDDTLLICGFLDGELQRWDVGSPTPSLVETIGPCLTGVTTVDLGDDASGARVLVTATADALVALPMP
ncbi:MAG: hypothetical protein AAGA42_07015 [Actinomycetota bacterium]